MPSDAANQLRSLLQQRRITKFAVVEHPADRDVSAWFSVQVLWDEDIGQLQRWIRDAGIASYVSIAPIPLPEDGYTERELVEAARTVAMIRKAELCFPSETQCIMFASSSHYLLHVVAAKQAHCPPEILDRFAASPNVDVRETVAANTSTSPETLAVLIVDKDRRVVFAAKNNTNLSPAVRAFHSL